MPDAATQLIESSGDDFSGGDFSGGRMVELVMNIDDASGEVVTEKIRERLRPGPEDPSAKGEASA